MDGMSSLHPWSRFLSQPPNEQMKAALEGMAFLKAKPVNKILRSELERVLAPKLRPTGSLGIYLEIPPARET